MFLLFHQGFKDWIKTLSKSVSPIWLYVKQPGFMNERFIILNFLIIYINLFQCTVENVQMTLRYKLYYGRHEISKNEKMIFDQYTFVNFELLIIFYFIISLLAVADKKRQFC